MIHIEKNIAETNSGQLKQQAFRQMLSEQERTYLVSHGNVFTIDTDTILCRQGKVEDMLYVILLGEVDVVEDIGGHNVLVGKLSTGDLVGEIGALLAVPRIASVVASLPTVVLEIKLETFKKLINKTPNLQGVVYQNLYERSLHTALRISTRTNNEKTAGENMDRVMQCWASKELN